eukprot:gene5599-7152_t
MATGQLLRVVSTDAGSVRDFQAFAKQTGNELVEQKEENRIFEFFLKHRRAPPGEPAAWCFAGLIDCLTAHDAASLAGLLARLDAEPGWSVMALDYELGYVLEPKTAPSDWAPGPERPLARVWRFAD